jgi:hypothetical protein
MRASRPGAFVIVALLSLAVVACGSSTKKSASPPTSSGSTSSTATSSTTAKKSSSAPYKVGDTAKTSGWEVTVYGVMDPWTSTNQFETPTAGNRFVQVDTQVRNTKSSQQTWSSLLSFKLLDSANRSYNVTSTTAQPGPPDGQVGGGEALRGFVSFEVPTDATGLIFVAQGSITAAGAKFALS